MFRIDANSGQIRTNNIPDRESMDTYRLRIRARDLGTPSKSVSKEFVITITDKNDNNPIFNDNYNRNVPENTKVNTEVVKVSTLYRDSADLELRYSNKEESGDGSRRVAKFLSESNTFHI